MKTTYEILINIKSFSIYLFSFFKYIFMHIFMGQGVYTFKREEFSEEYKFKYVRIFFVN